MLSIFVHSATLFDYRDPDSRREFAQCRWKIDVLVVHHKPEDAPARAAAEAMERLPAGANQERRGLLLVKRAERFEIRSRASERKIRTDHFDDVVRSRDLLDCF